MTNSLYTAVDRGNLGQMGDSFRTIKLGSALLAMLVATGYALVPTVALTGKPVTVDTIALPNKAKAQVILSAYARAGTGTKGPLTVVASGTIPSAGEIAVSPDGDIVTAAADAWTLVDVMYVPAYGDVVEDLELTVSSNTATFPARYQDKVVALLKAEALTGTVTGRQYIDKPGASLSSQECALALTKNSVAFKNTDGVTSCKLTFLVYPEVNAHDALLAESPLVL